MIADYKKTTFAGNRIAVDPVIFGGRVNICLKTQDLL